MTARAALQGCLAAEHAAVYGYGVLGGVLAGHPAATGERALAAEGYAAHRARRDTLTDLLVKSDVDPVAAEPAYEVPFRVVDVADCRRLGQHLERRSGATYSSAVAQTVDDTRRLLAGALTDAAVREVRWGAEPRAFPGVAEL